MKQQMIFLQNNVASAEQNLSSDDQEQMTDHIKMHNCWAPMEFYTSLHHIANHNRMPNTEPTVEAHEIELILQLIFSLAVYGVALDMQLKGQSSKNSFGHQY
jgi:hypothetical protein